MIPNVRREKLLSAIALFDKTKRNTVDWLNWERNKTHKRGLAQVGQGVRKRQIAQWGLVNKLGGMC